MRDACRVHDRSKSSSAGTTETAERVLVLDVCDVDEVDVLGPVLGYFVIFCYPHTRVGFGSFDQAKVCAGLDLTVWCRNGVDQAGQARNDRKVERYKHYQTSDRVARRGTRDGGNLHEKSLGTWTIYEFSYPSQLLAS